jgi:hypothetical protein
MVPVAKWAGGNIVSPHFEEAFSPLDINGKYPQCATKKQNVPSGGLDHA